MGSSAGVGAGVDLKDSDEVIFFSGPPQTHSHSRNHFFLTSDIMEFNRRVGIWFVNHFDFKVKEYLDNLGVEYRLVKLSVYVASVKSCVADLGVIMKKTRQPVIS